MNIKWALSLRDTRIIIYFLIYLLYMLTINVGLTSSYHISVLAYSDSLLNGSSRLHQDIVAKYFPAITDIVPLKSGFIAAHSAGFVFWSLTSLLISRFLGLEHQPFYFESFLVLNILSTLVGIVSIIYVEKIARLYLNPRDALILTFSYAVGSLTLVYSSTAYSQSFAAPFVAIGLYYLLVYLRSGKLRYLLLTATFYSIATYSDHTLIVLGLSVLIVLIKKKKASSLHEVLSYISCYMFLLIPVVAYYILITGSLTPTQSLYPTYLGLQPLDVSRIVTEFSLLELLFGLRKGLLITAPALLIFSLHSFLYIEKTENLEKFELIYTLTLFFLGVILYSSWYDWHGGLSYGPRLLYSILPLLSVTSSISLKYGRRVLTFLLLSNIGALFNVLTTSTNPFSCAYQDLVLNYIPQAVACNLPSLLSICRNPTVLGSLGFSCTITFLLLFGIVVMIDLLYLTISL